MRTILFYYFAEYSSPDEIGLTLYRSSQPRILREKGVLEKNKMYFRCEPKGPKLNLFRLLSSLFHETKKHVSKQPKQHIPGSKKPETNQKNL